MDNDKKIEDFLKLLRINLNNALIYFSEHPAFINGINGLMTKLDAVLDLYPVFQLGIMPKCLVVDGKRWEKVKLYEELAEIFHQRKIKTIEFHKGVSSSELKVFVFQSGLAPRDILKAGGLNNILKVNNIEYIKSTDLDYSQLLAGQGQESKDVWQDLLNVVLTHNDAAEIEQFTANFHLITAKFNGKDFINDRELNANIIKFLLYLKDNQRDKFFHCSQEVIKAILRDRDIPDDARFDEFTNLFNALEDEELSNILWEQLMENDRFDHLSFKLFNKLIDSKKHKNIALSIDSRLKLESGSGKKEYLAKKISGLFNGVKGDLAAEVYQKTLVNLMDNINFSGNVSLERESLKNNYLYGLLNMFVKENNEKRLGLLNNMIVSEWTQITRNDNKELLKNIIQIIEDKIKTDSRQKDILSGLLKNIAQFAAEIMFAERILEFDFLLPYVNKENLDWNLYLNKIFKENRLTAHDLFVLFTFFPEQQNNFYVFIQKKIYDTVFIRKVIEACRMLRHDFCWDLLARIFFDGSDFIKVEAVKAMQIIPLGNCGFLLPFLKGNNLFLKKEIIRLFSHSSSLIDRAVKTMSEVNNFMGFQEELIAVNLRIIEEFNLRCASDYLQGLAKSIFFWHVKTKKIAVSILKQWQLEK